MLKKAILALVCIIMDWWLIRLGSSSKKHQCTISSEASSTGFMEGKLPMYPYDQYKLMKSHKDFQTTRNVTLHNHNGYWKRSKVQTWQRRQEESDLTFYPTLLDSIWNLPVISIVVVSMTDNLNLTKHHACNNQGKKKNRSSWKLTIINKNRQLDESE